MKQVEEDIIEHLRQIKPYSLKVNIYESKSDITVVNLINSIPILAFCLAGIIGIIVDQGAWVFFSVLLASLVGILLIFTRVYNNATIYLDSEGIYIKENNGISFIKWEEIEKIAFGRDDSTESFLQPILLFIDHQDKDRSLAIYLGKYWFSTPRKKYFKFLAMVGCIDKSRNLLLSSLEEFYHPLEK